MHSPPGVCLLAAIGAVLAGLPALAEAFSCGEQLLEVNAGEEEVLGKCGVPDWSETWEEELIERSPGEAFERSTTVARAEWIYDLGPTRLIGLLGFRNGVLQTIDTRAAVPAAPAAQCNASIVAIGDSRFEVLRKCGQPASRSQVTEKRMEPLDALRRRRHAVTTERWTYRATGDALPHTIVFRDRRVVSVEPGANP